MDMLTDPEMKDIVDDFVNESKQLLDQLEETLEALEEDPNKTGLETFGQTIDRIMGAAKSIGANKIGMYCELGKIIGYKSSQADGPELIKLVVPILFDSVEILQGMLDSVSKGKGEVLTEINTEAFGTRLKWLADKFNDIERSSVALESGAVSNKVTGNKELNSLLTELGL
ncbi:MAG: hypothetical protein HN509_15110 [Halobacteriovoraceae bacterium]|jgi:chemotaxis protein histidine kinase CheA|nr:hypothetical protein [Halobacteriovoraceae bacterium]MBT5095746.1 hypothetical protein [Halobacteriovoraceae bacterium]